jgi:hypothetical protein
LVETTPILLRWLLLFLTPADFVLESTRREVRSARVRDAAAPTAGNEEGGGGAAGLAQRAQRLSVMQYRQGKVSKAALLARTSRQAAAGGGADDPAQPES